jgi:diaminohydroxyphosphoribosylaminopyrimidine deaminase/5-amino-6-(5-phosphoribosylamino)uracil reductase
MLNRELPTTFISQALKLAKAARPNCSPNPAVGCVLVNNDSKVIGEGHTQKVGEAHAEIMAIRDAHRRGESTLGATAYVTLEPCSHQGRTGPCCDALIHAGISKVVASAIDPNPMVSGQGFARLRAADVQVEFGDGEQETRELNIGFFKRMETGLPWVRLKIAMTLDGKIALLNGKSQWITSVESRVDGHSWRARADAIMTGSGTIISDDPRLDVRLVEATKQPLLVIIDGQLKTPPAAQCLIPNRPKVIYSAIGNNLHKKSLQLNGVEIISLPNDSKHESHRVDLKRVLSALARKEINEIHVEGGNGLNSALLKAGLVDELLVYVAPKLVGKGLDMANLDDILDLADAQQLDFHSIQRLGPDLRLLMRPSVMVK